MRNTFGPEHVILYILFHTSDSKYSQRYRIQIDASYFNAGTYYVSKGEAMADSSAIIIQIRYQYSLFCAAAPVIVRDVRGHGRMHGRYI